ncbi:MAG: hypothetical protein KIH67_004575 [Candidatus Moranbacteria bacterium]|nr:hypothetical protein [Candidatus Moranbacteria bacterium]
MGRPTKNAFHGGGRPVDMATSPQADMRPKGAMTPEAYQAMKAEKRKGTAERRAKKSARKTGTRKKK